MNAVVPFPGASHSPDTWIAERLVLELRPMLSLARLRAARAGHKIEWTKGKRGTAWYRLADVDEYIRGEMTCRVLEVDRSLTSADNGSPESPNGAISTVTGLSPELESHVANHLAQRI